MTTNSDIDELKSKIYAILHDDIDLRTDNGQPYLYMTDTAEDNLIELIAAQQLALLDRLEKHKEDLFWWTGGEYTKTTGIDMRAIQQERSNLSGKGE